MPVPESSDRFHLESQIQVFLKAAEEVELALQNMEDMAKEREDERKKILRKEYSKWLMLLNFKDNEAVSLMKAATIESLLKLKKEASVIRKAAEKSKETSGESDDMENKLMQLTGLTHEAEALVRNTQLSLGIESNVLRFAMEQNVYLKTKGCDPKKFFLLFDNSKESKQMAIVAQMPNSFDLNFVKTSMQIVYSAVNPSSAGSADDDSTIPILRNSLQTCLKIGHATLVNQHFVQLDLPASPTGFGQLEISILGVYIMNAAKTRFGMKVTKPGEISCFLDDTMHHDLDQSDLRSLDLTRRNRVKNDHQSQTQASKIRVKDFPVPFPTPDSIHIDSEVSDDRTTQLNVTSPFSPNSEAQYSTMRETSAARLAEMLSSASVEIPYPETEPEVYLAPASEEGRRSVEELQKTLSRENSRENSPQPHIVDVVVDQKSILVESPSKRSFVVDDVPVADRSIVFSTKTTIYQELATPQVKVEKRRYSIQEGNTKTDDGVAGLQRKLLNVQLEEEQQPQVRVEKTSEPPKVPEKETDSSKLDESANRLEESIYRLDESISSDESKWEKTFVDLGPNPALDGTLWDLEPDREKFNFLNGKLRVLSTRIPGIDRTGYLEGPAFMTWIAKHKVILVTEPFHNRVCVYDDETLELRGRFPGKTEVLKRPLHILYLSDESVALIQHGGLYIYTLEDARYKVSQIFKGNFIGLSEGDPGELLTIQFISDVPYIKIFNRSLESDEYSEGDCIELTVAKSDRSGVSPKPRNMICKDGVVYMTDSEMARLFIVDRISGEQTSCGYFGGGEGQFRKPLGLLQDDIGHILVADNETSNILVFNAKGHFIKRLKYKTDLLRPMGFIRQGNCILLCFFGENQQNQGIIRFELEPLTEEKEWKGSPVDPLNSIWDF